MRLEKIDWKERIGLHTIECSVDVAIHENVSDIVFLTVPGVDGSLDGYENKYLRIADDVSRRHSVTCIRMSNPFISSSHWDKSLRITLQYIFDNLPRITTKNDCELRIMGHSVGASVLADIAWEYPQITRLLLINPATKYGLKKIEAGMNKFNGDVTILLGDKDPSFKDIITIKERTHSRNIFIEVLSHTNHHFSGNSFEFFLSAPNKYLFNG